MDVISYKTFPSNFKLSLGEIKKEGNIRKTEIKNNNKPFYLQTPKVHLKDNSINIDYKFENVLSQIVQQIKDYIMENSRELFNGKVFTLEKIDKSLNPPYENNNLSLDIAQNIRIIDQFGKELSVETLNYDCALCILLIKELQFIKTKINLVIELTNVKVYYYSKDCTKKKTKMVLLEKSNQSQMGGKNETEDFFED